MAGIIISDENYTAAKADPLAALILSALHDQDARTYNGHSSDIGTLALDTAAKVRAEFVLLKPKSYRQAQERQRVAEALRAAEERHTQDLYSWMSTCHAEERRLRDRCTFLYGVARAHGATADELRGE